MWARIWRSASAGSIAISTLASTPEARASWAAISVDGRQYGAGVRPRRVPVEGVLSHGGGLRPLLLPHEVGDVGQSGAQPAVRCAVHLVAIPPVAPENTAAQ